MTALQITITKLVTHTEVQQHRATSRSYVSAEYGGTGGRSSTLHMVAMQAWNDTKRAAERVLVLVLVRNALKPASETERFFACEHPES